MAHVLTKQDKEGPAFAMGFACATYGKDNYRNPCSGNAISSHNYYAGFVAGMAEWERVNKKPHPGR